MRYLTPIWGGIFALIVAITGAASAATIGPGFDTMAAAPDLSKYADVPCAGTPGDVPAGTAPRKPCVGPGAVRSAPETAFLGAGWGSGLEGHKIAFLDRLWRPGGPGGGWTGDPLPGDHPVWDWCFEDRPGKGKGPKHPGGRPFDPDPDPGDVGAQIPLPASGLLLASGLALMRLRRRS